jgi:hypothetical protein
MQAYVDVLSSTLIERYKLYLQTFLVDLWSEGGLIEFRFGYSLRCDSKLHTRTFKVGAQEALTSAERLAIVDAMFAEIEDHIDETISATLVELN